MRRERCTTGTGTRVSPRLTSLLFLLGKELYRQPRAVYKYWAGGLCSCDHAASSSSISSCSTSVSVHRQSVGHSCYASETGIRIATVQVRGAHHYPVVDVPVITQLMFLQYFDDVEVPQIPSSTECYRFQLYYRVVYVQCKLCKHRRCHSAVLGLVVHAPVVMLRQLFGVGQRRKLWRFRSWSCSWTRLLTCPCWSRHGVVEVPQLQFIDWCVSSSWLDELMRRLFRAVYTGTRPGVDPRHQGGEGVAGTPGACSQVFCHPN